MWLRKGIRCRLPTMVIVAGLFSYSMGLLFMFGSISATYTHLSKEGAQQRHCFKCVILFVLSVSLIAVSLLLVYAVLRHKLRNLMPWLIWNGISVALEFYVAVYRAIYEYMAWYAMLLAALMIVAHLYLLWLVMSYYHIADELIAQPKACFDGLDVEKGVHPYVIALPKNSTKHRRYSV